MRLGRLRGEELLHRHSLFHRCFNRFCWQHIFLSLRIAHAVFLTASVFLLTLSSLSLPLPILVALTFLLPLSIDCVGTCLAAMAPLKFFKRLSFFISPLLVLFRPLNFFFPLSHPSLSSTEVPLRLKEKIADFMQESELSSYLDAHDQKLLLSVASFKERIAREIMVPRIDLFSLPAETSLQDATHYFLKEGYSRIPIFQDNIDNIIGVLLYKDVLNAYVQSPLNDLNSKENKRSIQYLIKPILYTPETKKISQLLQEFRAKQIHLAIVVDEYGGTEGIITIEDILEELVGEIADEYDVEEELLYVSHPDGGWIVDAKMGILDIEEELKIKIPSSPEYDTIGGYVFHRAGAIPEKGWKMHHDDFDLEVLASNDRSIDKIRITPFHRFQED
jgi:putative hemolysin